MNNKFGILENGNIEYAPSSLKIDGIIFSKPTDQQYLDNGYKSIKEVKPEVTDGYHFEFDENTEDDSTIYQNYKLVEDPVFTENFQISKLYLRVALSKLGMWEKVENWMKGFDIDLGNGMIMNCWDAYCDATVLDTGNEFFEPYLKMAKDKFKDYISSEDVDKLLLSCKTK